MFGEDNILKSMKKMLGLDNEDTSFDIDIIIDINSVLNILVQLGVEPFYRVYLHTGEEKWSDYIDDDNLYRMIETYTYLRVKDYFDPPTSGVLAEAIERRYRELEWRIREMAGEIQWRLDALENSETSSDEWYNIVHFIKDHPEDIFAKGMKTSPLSDHDVAFYKAESLMYAFAASNDQWHLVSDSGGILRFVCTKGEHKNRDYNIIYDLDESTKTAELIKEFISTDEYELAQWLDGLEPGSTGDPDHILPDDDDDIELSSEWYNIIKFIKGHSGIFQKGMATSPLSADDVQFYRENSPMYTFTVANDKWRLVDDSGKVLSFICDEGDHKDRDYIIVYTIDEVRKVAFAKEFISTPEYELAQKLIDLPVGGTL